MSNWREINVPGYNVVAQALLSRGNMTAPRSAFVAVRQPGTDEHAEVIVAEWNHQTGGWSRSSYFNAGNGSPKDIARAYEEFAERLMKDARRYIARDVPLTVEGEA